MKDASSIDKLAAWTTLSSQTVHDGFFKLRMDSVTLPNGKKHTYDYIVQRPCATVLLQDSTTKEFIMVRQYRYPVGTVCWEAPMGGIDKGESPEMAARREAIEETGYQVEKIFPLGVMEPSHGSSTQVFHLFYATCSYLAGEMHEETEFLEIQKISPARLGELLDTNEITDAATTLAILLALRRGLIALE
jgi:ADP-ribose pyrophosphatase